MTNTYEIDYTKPATEKQMDYLKILRPSWDWSEVNLTIGQASCEIEDLKAADKATREQIAFIDKVWNSMSAEEQAAQLEGYGIDSI